MNFDYISFFIERKIVWSVQIAQTTFESVNNYL